MRECDRAWQTLTAHWKCAACGGRKTSVTAGTIFHRTRTPLSTWFADGSKCQVCCPVRVNGTNEMDAKPFSAEVLLRLAA